MGTVHSDQLVKPLIGQISVSTCPPAGSGGGFWDFFAASVFCRVSSRRTITSGRWLGGTLGSGAASTQGCQGHCLPKAQASSQMSIFFFMGRSTSISHSCLKKKMDIREDAWAL